jgi:hypothetical protein
MVDDYMKTISTIHNLLISSNIVREFVEKVSRINRDKYILDIGSILYNDGKIKDNHTFFPYDVYIKRGKENYNSVNNSSNIRFKIAITFGIEEYSKNYQSNPNYIKGAIKTKSGIIVIGKGEYLHNEKDIRLYEKDIACMDWNSDLDIQTLKDKVNYWGSQLSYKEYYARIGNDKYKIRKNDIYKDGETYLELHHIDNNSNNNKLENLLWVTREQHASIHLFMWNYYFLEENFLKSNYNKNI